METLPVRRTDLWRWNDANIVRFRGGPRMHPRQFGPTAWTVYRVPRDTRDPRFETCTDHHVACDCREALHAEDMQELRGELRMWREAADQALFGHPTEVWVDGDRVITCGCTGCQIARGAYYRPEGTPWSAAEAGRRWTP